MTHPTTIYVELAPQAADGIAPQAAQLVLLPAGQYSVKLVKLTNGQNGGFSAWRGSANKRWITNFEARTINYGQAGTNEIYHASWNTTFDFPEEAFNHFPEGTLEVPGIHPQVALQPVLFWLQVQAEGGEGRLRIALTSI